MTWSSKGSTATAVRTSSGSPLRFSTQWAAGRRRPKPPTPTPLAAADDGDGPNNSAASSRHSVVGVVGVVGVGTPRVTACRVADPAAAGDGSDLSCSPTMRALSLLTALLVVVGAGCGPTVLAVDPARVAAGGVVVVDGQGFDDSLALRLEGPAGSISLAVSDVVADSARAT